MLLQETSSNLWLPGTTIYKANNGSYLVQVTGGGQYRCAHDHIGKCHPDAVKPDTYNIGNVVPGSETANSCCTCNTNTSCYPANSMKSSTFSMFATMNTDTIHWSSSEPDWHSTCCLMLINSKQEVTIQDSWIYRPGLSLTDDPDDAMIQISPDATAEMLYH